MSLEPPRHVVIVAARDEADRIADTVAGVRAAFPGAQVIVADGGSRDATAAVAARAGAQLVRAGTRGGKGRGMTVAARRALAEVGTDALYILCDGDLGSSAARLAPLAAAVERGDCDLAVAAFARKQGGGLGIAVGFARRAIRAATGLELRAPISGQRAMKGTALRKLLPFAPGFGIETAMTIDAVRAGLRVNEIDLDLEHRATGRDAAGFLHRGRQLAAFARVYLSRGRRKD